MYDFGKIILVPFPFTDLTSKKVRPALIISKNNDRREDVIVSFISSQLSSDLKDGILVREKDLHFVRSGLKVSSVVRLDKIATLHKKLVLGEIGHLPKSVLQKQKKKFSNIFGF